MAAVVGLACIVGLLKRGSDEDPVARPATPTGGDIIIAPRIPLRRVFRPRFKTPDHEFEAGAAFLARVSFCEDPLLFTALQNIGPAGGYYRQATGESLGDTVSGIELRDAYSGAKVLSPEIAALALRGTSPLGTPGEIGDVAVFRARGSSHLEPGSLSEEPAPPAPGSHVWLAIGEPPRAEEAPPEAAGEETTAESPAPRIHHGIVRETRDGLLSYTLDDATVSLRGSAGAPLIAQGGRIVGIHLGSASENGTVYGLATPVSRFLGALREACQPEPRTAGAGGQAQN